MTEDHLQTAVIDMAHLFGLKVAHFRPAQIRPGKWVTPVQADGKGFPDLVIAGPGGVLFRELKSAAGTLSAEQRMWLHALKSADVGVWRPADLQSGRIEQELRAVRLAK